MAQAFGKKLLSAPVWAKLIPLCYFGYTGAVFQNQTLHDKKCVGVYNYPHFSPGSADELLRDHLNTGDIVLFNRRWYSYYLIEAIQIKMYQYFYETEYDHVGICVLDKYGEPFLLEKTLNGVHKLRPFEKRILHSKAQQIMLIPVMPRESEEDEVAASERLQWRERDGLLGMHAGQSQGQGQGSNKDKGKNSNENENIVNSIDWEDRRGLLQEYVRRLLQVGGNSGGRAEGQKQVFVPYLPRLSAVPANRRPHPEIIEGGVEANKCRNMQEMAALYAEIGLTLKSGSAQGQKQKQRQTKRQKEKEKEKKQKSLSLSLKQLEEDAVLLKDSEGAGRVFSEQHIMVRTK